MDLRLHPTANLSLKGMMLIYIIGHVLAVGIGVSLGLLGGGGSVLALPVLVYVMGIPAKSAIAMTLIIVGSVSLLGAIPHWRRGNIHAKNTLLFGSATMLGSYWGSILGMTPWVTDSLQMLLFGLTMFLAAGLMIYRTAQPERPTSRCILLVTAPVGWRSWVKLMFIGIGVGGLTGLVGVGGGFAIVPALVLLGKIPMKQAIGSSLVIIAGSTAAGSLGYWGHLDLDLPLTVSFTLLAGVGTVLGSHLGQFVPARQLQKGFGYFLLAIATFVLIKNHFSF